MTAIEEIGVLGSGMSCLYSLVSMVGEAIHQFGTPEQKGKSMNSKHQIPNTNIQLMTKI